ncbi:MAG: hypothetical protein IKQ48_05670 [Paludibacteraceae bacterium]|nr:hypothetical protein [Paludibacteraceae bacterium]
MRQSSAILLSLAATILMAACNTPGVDPGKDPKPADAMPKSAKRGVAFSFSQITDLPLLSPYISWDYNWGNTPSDEAALWFDTNEMDYCPMCWNGNYNADKIRAFVAAHPKTRYLLAFNEPNLTDQARMTPAEAASLWAPVVALAKELNLQLVSPAMNYGTLPGYSDPIKWLDEFFTQPGVSIDDIYAISIHCYMASASGLQGFVERFEKYNKPIWLTEFCAWDPVPGSVNTQMDYMCAALHYLETRPSVERYAWFIPRTGNKVDTPPYMQLLTHDYPAALTDLGKMYCYFSPMDTTVWLKTDRFILANEYTRVKNHNMPLRPTTDQVAVSRAGRDGLMITNLIEGQELTYQVYVTSPSRSKAIEIRYCGYSNSICEVMADGVTLTHIDMPRNGSSTEWIDASMPVQLAQGAHTITLKLLSGSCYFSGFSIAGTDD